MTQIYQEEPNSTFFQNGVRYSLNKIFDLVHTKPDSQINVKDLIWILPYNLVEHSSGNKICGSCLDDTNQKHIERVKKSDLSVPIIVTKLKEKWVVVDGIHRLEKAVKERVTTLNAKLILQKELELCKE